MENFSYLYNQLLHLNSSGSFSPASSSASDGIGTSTDVHTANFCDEEFMLASTHPKKRAGRKKFGETRHPVYRGIRPRNSSKWVCEVREPNKKSRIWLGTYPTADMAARAHDVAAIALKGRSVCLNFADSMWRLPIPASNDVKDIQKAAAEAAEAFRPSQSISDDVSVDDMVQVSDTSLPENVFYTDEAAVLVMQELLANMAEGLMPPPPYCADGYTGDDVEVNADISLRSCSI